MVAITVNAMRLALSAIARNKTRAALTVLGIMIGIAAVVTVTALATTATDKVGGQLDSFAANALFINPRPSQQAGMRRASARLTDGDGRAIAREANSVAAVAPFSGAQAQVVVGDRNASTQVVGTTIPYMAVRRFSVERGAMWTEADETLKTKVCIIGPTLAKKLFDTDDPVGQTVRVGRSPYRVIGVMAPKGSSPFGDDQDDRLMMPMGSYRARVVHTYHDTAQMLIASASSAETSDRAIEQISAILRQRHHIRPGFEDDFRVGSQKEFRALSTAVGAVLSALLLGVAAVSLLVGGVGVMNIMLVSVSERTREIGIRMSIGAREKDILLQFLIEAVTLSMLGGLAGIAVGMSAALGLGYALDWRVVPRFDALAVALVTSAFIGVVFGFLPARRAAQMDPIDALRTE